MAKSGKKGFSIIEVLVGVTVLSIIVTSTSWFMLLYLRVMADAKLTSQAESCGKAALEYFTSLPPDYLYSIGGGNATTYGPKSFAGAYGAEKLNSWLDLNSTGSNRCRELSTDPTIKLEYLMCVGCRLNTLNASAPSGRCIFHVWVAVEWDSPFMKGKSGIRRQRKVYDTLRDKNAIVSNCYDYPGSTNCDTCPEGAP